MARARNRMLHFNSPAMCGNHLRCEKCGGETFIWAAQVYQRGHSFGRTNNNFCPGELRPITKEDLRRGKCNFFAVERAAEKQVEVRLCRPV